MDSLRKPFLILAVILSVVIVLLEVGSLALPDNTGTLSPAQFADNPELLAAFLEVATQANNAADDRPPGMGISYMALVDAEVLLTIGLIGASLIVPARLQARVQGFVTCGFSCLVILGTIGLVFLALGLLILMVSLFLAVPFGTIAYLALYGFFNRGGASAMLALLMLLKLGMGASLIIAQQRFLQNKGLVLLIITSLVCNVIISFLHGLVPIILVSITDAIAAICMGIIAIIWAILLLIGAVMSILKIIRPDPSFMGLRVQPE
ncbi:MAG: hypothetical protein HZC41_08090 [Chloroflexi bacterium]|nr:hypothetical protein [Chloroflexota bacterium]